MQIGICEWSTGAGEEETFRRLRRVGLSGMQVTYEPKGFFEKMSRYGEWAAKYNVTLTSVGGNVFCEEPLMEPKNRARLETVITDIAKGAALTQNRLFHVPAFGASQIRESHREADYDRMVTALQLICDLAAEWRVRVASENLLSLMENQQLLNDVNRCNFAIYLDNQNPQMTSHPDAAAQAVAFVEQFSEVHIKDCDAAGVSVPLGRGVTGVVQTLKALRRGGFDGWLLLENGYGAADIENAMHADVTWLRGVLCKN